MDEPLSVSQIRIRSGAVACVALAALFGLAVSGTSLCAAAAPACPSLLHKGLGPAVAVLSGGNWPQAEMNDVRSSVGAEPANAVLVARLAGLEAASGDAAGSMRLVQASAALSYREPWTQMRLLLDALARGSADETVLRLDVLLRIGVEHIHTLMPIIAVRGWTPEMIARLRDVVAKNPPWRKAIILWFTTQPPDSKFALAFLREIADHLSPAELSPFLGSLIRTGRAGDARDLWLASLSAERRADAGALFNRGFERDPDGSPFDWNASQSANVSVAFRSADGGGPGRIAEIDVLRGLNADPLLTQTLTLEPGRWTLSGRIRMSGIDAQEGIIWTLACVGGPVDAPDTPFTGTFDWRRFDVEFTVPAENCGAQNLWLRAQTRVPADADFGGLLALSGLSLDRKPD